MKTYPIKILLLSLALPLLFTGCAEVKEINDMAIISGFSIDLDESGLYTVTAEVVNKSTEGAPDESREVISATGHTLGDALENCNFQDSRQLYFSHAKTLAVSRRLAEQEGIEDVLDYVMRNYKTRLSMDLLVSDLPTAAAVAELSSSSTGLIYFDLEEMIKTDRQYGACTPMKVYQAVNTLSQKGTEMTVPLLRRDGEKVILDGTAVFLRNKMIAELTSDETLYLLMLQDHLTKAHLTLPKQGMTFQVTDSRFSAKPQTDSSGAQSLNVTLTLSCTVSQAGGQVQNYSSQSLKEALERSVEQSCSQLIRKAQSWNSDIFGFGKSMGAAPYEFSKLPVQVSCQVNLKIGEVHE